MSAGSVLPSSSTHLEIVLVGHCTFCVQRFSSTGDEKSGKDVQFPTTSNNQQVVQVKEPVLISAFQNLWQYLHCDWCNKKGETGEHFLFKNEPGAGSWPSPVPPMCTNCYKNVVKIDELYVEFEILKRKLLGQATKMKELILECGKDGIYSGRLEKFERNLTNSTSVTLACFMKTMDFMCNLRGIQYVPAESLISLEDTHQLDPGEVQSNVRSIPPEPDCSSGFEYSDSGKNKASAVPCKRQTIVIKTEEMTESEAESAGGDDGDEDYMAEDDEDEIANEPEPSVTPRSLDNAEDKVDKVAKAKRAATTDEEFPRRKRAKISGIPHWRKQNCDVCNVLVPISQLRDHLLVHLKTPDFIFVCPNINCGQTYISRRRRDMVHIAQRPKCFQALNKPRESLYLWKCASCDFQGNYHLFKKHIIEHENATKSFPCPFPNCGNSFTIKQSLEVHIDQFHIFKNDPKKHEKQKCVICLAKIDTSSMEQHIREYHKSGTVLKCTQCSFAYPSMHSFVRHKMVHHRLGEGLLCDFCQDGKRYPGQTIFQAHYFNVHGIGEKYLCEECNLEFFEKYCLTKHKLTVHKNMKPYKCEICVNPIAEFKTKFSLTKHKVKEHGINPYVCTICKQEYRDKKLYESHRKTHQPRKPMFAQKCDFCEKTFTKESSLKLHRNVEHLNEPLPHICDLCGNGYKSAQALKTHHKGVHLGEKDFICGTCGLAFGYLETLREHERRHTGEKPFTCQHCGQPFRQRSGLMQHLKYHKDPNFVPKGPMAVAPKRNYSYTNRKRKVSKKSNQNA